MSSEFIRLQSREGASLLVEVEPVTNSGDTELVARQGPISLPLEHFGARINSAIQILGGTLTCVREHLPHLDQVEVEMGIKFTAEGGVIIAKGSAEASLNVKAVLRGKDSKS